MREVNEELLPGICIDGGLGSAIHAVRLREGCNGMHGYI